MLLFQHFPEDSIRDLEVRKIITNNINDISKGLFDIEAENTVKIIKKIANESEDLAQFFREFFKAISRSGSKLEKTKLAMKELCNDEISRIEPTNDKELVLTYINS